MKTILPAFAFVFVSGFAVMVLEIIGARYLAVDFGSSFYVWTSQIGVILVALALGYSIGGAAADRFRRAAALRLVLAPAGVFTFFIPAFAPTLLDRIVMRHPLDGPIPYVWQKLDPMLGSALIFFPPCFALAMVSPYMIRLGARRLDDVGLISGAVFAAGTAGSILGVFVSGYGMAAVFPQIYLFPAQTSRNVVLMGLKEPNTKENSELQTRATQLIQTKNLPDAFAQLPYGVPRRLRFSAGQPPGRRAHFLASGFFFGLAQRKPRSWSRSDGTFLPR